MTGIARGLAYTLILGLGVLAALPVEAQEGGRLVLTEREIIVIHPTPLAREVITQEGWCGPTRYGLVLRYQFEDWQRRLGPIRAGRRRIDPAVRAAIAGSMRPNLILDRAGFDQCSDDNGAARLRLSLTENPGAGSRLVFLDLWIRRDGTIASVRFN
jgi:hypothetical protein